MKKNLLGVVVAVSMIILLSSFSGPGSLQMEKETREEDEGMWLALNAEHM
ncbi:MAG: hypothetical protein Q8P49_02240 [Candidatus Liptonbacteria bacterium]|nr:hypothetical protein [Candidatus Liptonbacteria bacterium]